MPRPAPLKPLTDAERELAARHFRRARAIAWRLAARRPCLRDEIESACMWALVKAARNEHSGVGTFEGFLRMCCEAAYIDMLRLEGRKGFRRRKAKRPLSLSDGWDRAWDDPGPDRVDAADSTAPLLARLNETERVLVDGRCRLGETAAETGARLGMKKSAAGMRLARALAKLRTLLESPP